MLFGVVVKIIGCMLLGGFLFGGWGMVFGAVAGGMWSISNLHEEVEEMRRAGMTRQKYFETTFQVAGHIAQADGQVSVEEIACVQQTLDQIGLPLEYDELAMQYFELGTQPDFDLKQNLRELSQACAANRTLIAYFIEIQVAVACADGDFSEPEQQIMWECCAALRFPEAQVEELARRYLSGSQSRAGPRSTGAAPIEEDLDWACKILEIKLSTPWDEVRKIYARKMKEFHPDKLVSKGLPREFLEFANERTKEFTRAYQIIKKEMQP